MVGRVTRGASNWKIHVELRLGSRSSIQIVAPRVDGTQTASADNWLDWSLVRTAPFEARECAFDELQPHPSADVVCATSPGFVSAPNSIMSPESANVTLEESAQLNPEASLLLALEEISHLVSQAETPAATLNEVVKLIHHRFATDVCSVYLLTADRVHLELAATVGLRPECVGVLRMGLHEGLAGLVAQELKPISVDNAFQHPRFKYFPDAGEDPYNSFLGIPLFDRGVLQGVLVVQTVNPRSYSADELRMLQTSAGQMGPLLSSVRTLGQRVVPAYERLWTLARNLWWCWDADAVCIFRDLHPTRWNEGDHSPISLLSQASREGISQKIAAGVLHSRIQNACHRLEEYLKSNKTWGARFAGVLRARPVAYFSAEFGLHESIPIYSGGLGVLAGDHVKSASDLGVPLVGVGLFYKEGYFRQRISHEGWQQENLPDRVEVWYVRIL